LIDIHLHILPGVDDGPKTMEQTLQLARALVQEGIHTAIATPHYNDEFPQRPAAEIRERVGEVQQELERHAIPLRLFAGHEVLISPALLEDVQAGRVATLNGGRYLLLELWNSMWLPDTERIIFALRTVGIIPVLAHVERYRAIQQDHSRLKALLQQGVIAQITASSLIGLQGRTIRRCAEALLKEGLIQCIASDAHGLHTRPPRVAEGLQCVARMLGRERVHQMVEICPAAILNSTSIF
jgi:protein-tyrosine phosphatase